MFPRFHDHDGRVLHFALRPGATDAARPIVFANSLGTDMRIWGDVVARLPSGPDVLTHDKSGHGLSGAGAATISDHARDLAALMDAQGLSGALVCGVSVGGMIAQRLAADRPDLVAGLVLCNTGFRIGTPEIWAARIAELEATGLAGMADTILERWFSPRYRQTQPQSVRGFRLMLTRTPAEGYAAVCAAIRDADLEAEARRIACPTLCIAGSADLATPPEVVTALAEAIPGAGYLCLDGVGHLPCIEAPEAVATAVADLHAALP